MPLHLPVRTEQSLHSPPAVVPDTNATLDWLVFADGCMQTLGAAIEQGRLRWLTTTSMRDELTRVLDYPALARWAPDARRVLETFDRHAQVCPQPPACAWRCTDADDQVFIDLAVAQKARWLVTHDRALLALARRARGTGLQVIKPNAWALLDTATDSLQASV